MDTDSFLDYLDEHLLVDKRCAALNVPAWVDSPGLPTTVRLPARALNTDAALASWVDGTLPTEALPWSDWLYQ